MARVTLPPLQETRLGLSYVRERLERRRKSLLDEVATIDIDLKRLEDVDLLLVTR